jgi:hypothetical protein
MVAFRLRQQQLSGRTVHLWLNGPELGSYGAQKRFPDPVADGREIAQMALKIRPDLAQNPPKVRALGVTVSSLCRPQEQLYFGNHVSRQALNRALDRINSRFGEEAIYWAITGKKSRELF